MLNFWRITRFCLEKRLSKHKITKFSKKLGGMASLAPHGYAYAFPPLGNFLRTPLAGGNRIINCHRQTNRNRHNWSIWHNTWSTFFYKNHICFFLSVLKKTNTLHLYSMCGGIKTLKHNVRTTLQLAYHSRKNLAHTSKTRHVKRNQMVVTVIGSRFACFLLFRLVRIEHI